MRSDLRSQERQLCLAWVVKYYVKLKVKFTIEQATNA